MAQRVAIVHYWLLGMRGGEAVLAALCRMFPQADLFTLFYDPSRVSEEIRKHRVTASYLNPLRRWYRSLLPLMPTALESFDLRDYDLVLSSESGPAKGVLTSSQTLHVCYCHTPMRYLWELYPAYRNDWTGGRLRQAAMDYFAHRLRLWDYASAARVDQFLANSANVRRRIQKTYRRDAEIVHPPVPVGSFHYQPPHDYFLAVAELVAYKRLDYAVRWFARAGRRLRVVGDGPEYRTLRKLAGPTVEFCGRVPTDQLRELYARSRALIVPGEEDFGITMVEALASGKPVIALAKGGALEIVPDLGGELYDAATEQDLSAAVSRFEAWEDSIPPAELQASAQRFDEPEFERKIHRVLKHCALAMPPVPRVLVSKSISSGSL